MAAQSFDAWRRPARALPRHELDGHAADQHLHLCQDRNARIVIREPAREPAGQSEDPDELGVPFEPDNVDRIVDRIDLHLIRRLSNRMHVFTLLSFTSAGTLMSRPENR